MGEFRHVGEFVNRMLDEDFVRFGIDGRLRHLDSAAYT